MHLRITRFASEYVAKITNVLFLKMTQKDKALCARRRDFKVDLSRAGRQKIETDQL